jgi:hypothetical protein
MWGIHAIETGTALLLMTSHLVFLNAYWQAGNVAMVYIVRAVHVNGVTGTFTEKTTTRSEALELAKSLREEGLWVIITGPDGKTVDET